MASQDAILLHCWGSRVSSSLSVVHSPVHQESPSAFQQSPPFTCGKGVWVQGMGIYSEKETAQLSAQY